MEYKLVKISPSSRQGKKLMAVFENKKNGRKKTTHFGSMGMSDFTINKDEARKKRYLDRHRKRENWTDYTSAGALSRWLLWNKPTYKASLADFKTRFKL